MQHWYGSLMHCVGTQLKNLAEVNTVVLCWHVNIQIFCRSLDQAEYVIDGCILNW